MYITPACRQAFRISIVGVSFVGSLPRPLVWDPFEVNNFGRKSVATLVIIAAFALAARRVYPPKADERSEPEGERPSTPSRVEAAGLRSGRCPLRLRSVQASTPSRVEAAGLRSGRCPLRRRSMRRSMRLSVVLQFAVIFLRFLSDGRTVHKRY